MKIKHHWLVDSLRCRCLVGLGGYLRWCKSTVDLLVVDYFLTNKFWLYFWLFFSGVFFWTESLRLDPDVNDFLEKLGCYGSFIGSLIKIYDVSFKAWLSCLKLCWLFISSCLIGYFNYYEQIIKTKILKEKS